LIEEQREKEKEKEKEKERDREKGASDDGVGHCTDGVFLYFRSDFGVFR
jgi:hypothetical protein